MNLQPCGRFEWERILRRCVLPMPVKFTGCVLAQYGDVRGEGIRPGEPRLAAVLGMGESTLRRHLLALRSLGLVERLANGGGRGRKAAVYRLTVPVDLLDRVVMLDPDERPYGRDESVTPLPTVSGDSCGYQASTSVDNRLTPLTQDERSTERDGSLLRSVDQRTPLSLAPNSAHLSEHPPRDQPELHQGDSSPRVSVSPVGVDAFAPDPDPPDAETERRRQAAALDAWTATQPTATPEAS